MITQLQAELRLNTARTRSGMGCRILGLQIGVGVARSGETCDEILYDAVLTKKLKGVAAVEGSATKFYRFDGFIVDVQSACLRRDENPVPLRPKSFAALDLLQNPGRLVHKNELIDNVWSNVIVRWVHRRM